VSKSKTSNRKGRLFVITAPSGAGKTSLIDALTRTDPSLKLSISYTTRAPRPGEKDGVDYHFVDDADFVGMQGRGEFLESAEVHGYRYGTSKRVITEALARGEMEHAGEFDYAIINKDFDTARQELAAIIRKERGKPHGPHHR